MMVGDPLQWILENFKQWRTNEYSTSTAEMNALLANTTPTTTPRIVLVS